MVKERTEEVAKQGRLVIPSRHTVVKKGETGRDHPDYLPGEVITYTLSKEELAYYNSLKHEPKKIVSIPLRKNRKFN